MTHVGLIKAFFVIAIAFYPLIVYFGLTHLSPNFIAVLLLSLIAFRFGVLLPAERPVLLPVILIFAVYSIVAAVLGSAKMLLYYPALVNGCLCVVFMNSLRHGEPLLLRIIRARGWPISAHGPMYLRRLTAVWGGFFILNGAISLWTISESIEVWTLYNGFISYLLVAVLILGEWLFRRHYKRRMGVDT